MKGFYNSRPSFFPILGFIVLLVSMLLYSGCGPKRGTVKMDKNFYTDSRPFIRWWWFARILEKEDIRHQLQWFKNEGFGGVEVAFIYPVNRDPGMPRTAWLGTEWTEIVTYTKQYCDSIGLGCDFTFGTLWPFGGTFVPDEQRTRVFGDPDFKQPLRLSWTHPDTGNVIDHLSRQAFNDYAEIMGEALLPALKGSSSAIFCDSWEVETRKIWTRGFDSAFLKKYGYDITPFMDSILFPRYSMERYDYMKLVAEMVLDSFYRPFTQKAHELGACSRAQCAGSPTDIISSYASVDIPETEAMLYNPDFSRIVASSAALSGKNIVSSETFTCLYGWPRDHMFEENIFDLKLVADALFANGTNMIIWHGAPYNPVGIDTIYFYATVHVGKNGSLSSRLRSFNAYLEEISGYMQKGTVYSSVAMYLPLEDSWIAGEYPDSLQMPWSWGAYELRYLYYPEKLKGYQPLWINREFLEKGKVINNRLHVGDLRFEAFYSDAVHLDPGTLKIILHHAKQGWPVFFKQKPVQAGKSGIQDFSILADSLMHFSDPQFLNPVTPLVEGTELPDFWARYDSDTLIIFFSNPACSNLKYPLRYEQSIEPNNRDIEIFINWKENTIPVELSFGQNESILIKYDGIKLQIIDIQYQE